MLMVVEYRVSISDVLLDVVVASEMLWEISLELRTSRVLLSVVVASEMLWEVSLELRTLCRFMIQSLRCPVRSQLDWGCSGRSLGDFS